jgi:hypothetical protein
MLFFPYKGMNFSCDVSRTLLGTPIMPTYEDGHIICHYSFEAYKSMLWSSYDGPLTPSLFPSKNFPKFGH